MPLAHLQLNLSIVDARGLLSLADLCNALHECTYVKQKLAGTTCRRKREGRRQQSGRKKNPSRQLPN